VLVLLLVVVNLGYFGWQYGQRLETDQEPSAQYADGVPRLLMLSEAADSAVADGKSTGAREPDADEEATAAVPETVAVVESVMEAPVAETAEDAETQVGRARDRSASGDVGGSGPAVEAPEVSDSPADQKVATLAELADPEKIEQAPPVDPPAEEPPAQAPRAEESSQSGGEAVVASVETSAATVEPTTEQDIEGTSTDSANFASDEAALAASLAVKRPRSDSERQDAPAAEALQTSDSTEVAVASPPTDVSEVPMQETAPLVYEPPPAEIAAAQEASKALVCQTFGPLPSEEEAQRIQRALEGRAQRIVQRVTETEQVSSWWVVVPRPAEREARRALMKGLRESGLKDIWSVTRGELRGNVSLGIYGYRPNAERARDKAVSNGFVATIEPRVTTRSQYWLDMAIASPAGTPEPTTDIVEALDSLPEGASLTPTPCQQIVAAPTSP
jgi:hypothetical protein